MFTWNTVLQQLMQEIFIDYTQIAESENPSFMRSALYPGLFCCCRAHPPYLSHCYCIIVHIMGQIVRSLASVRLSVIAPAVRILIEFDETLHGHLN